MSELYGIGTAGRRWVDAQASTTGIAKQWCAEKEQTLAETEAGEASRREQTLTRTGLV